MSNKHQDIRSQARRIVTASPIAKECSVCGYSKSIQVCHIKAISHFPEGTSYDKINAKDNLCILCPNHHFEMDHHMLNFVPPSIAELEGVPPPAKLKLVRPKPRPSPKAKPGPAFFDYRNTPKMLSRLHLK